LRCGQHEKAVWTVVCIVGIQFLENNFRVRFYPTPPTYAETHAGEYMLSKRMNDAEHRQQHGACLAFTLARGRNWNEARYLASDKKLR